MESQPQNPEFNNNPENFHPCTCDSRENGKHIRYPEQRFYFNVQSRTITATVVHTGEKPYNRYKFI